MYRKSTTYRHKLHSEKKSNVKQITNTQKQTTKEPNEKNMVGKISSSPETLGNKYNLI